MKYMAAMRFTNTRCLCQCITSYIGVILRFELFFANFMYSAVFLNLPSDTIIGSSVGFIQREPALTRPTIIHRWEPFNNFALCRCYLSTNAFTYALRTAVLVLRTEVLVCSHDIYLWQSNKNRFSNNIASAVCYIDTVIQIDQRLQAEKNF